MNLSMKTETEADTVARKFSFPKDAAVEDLVLTVDNLCVKVGEKNILTNCSAYAKSGSILAIMGPSGSGKTTVLNTISGRLQSQSGEIQMNNKILSPKTRKKFGYVTQQDIFFPQLTLMQTLRFASNIKLPSKMKSSEKETRINQVIRNLDLTKCQDTLVGNFMMPGLSGGEKKRLNIACELIRNPKVLLLDEPTSGLDASLAMTIMDLLQTWALGENKIVITSIHQPSSQVFHVFKNLLLMTDGRVSYFGLRAKMVDYFESIGVTFHPHWNPADFMLEVVNSHSDKKDIIMNSATVFEKFELPVELASRSTSLVTKQVSHTGVNGDAPNVHLQAFYLENGEINKAFESDEVANGMPGEKPRAHQYEVAVNMTNSKKSEKKQFKFATSDNKVSWWTQFLALTLRSFLITKTRLFSPFLIIQFFFVALWCGLLWFQIPRKEDQIDDIRGVIFFITINLSFQPLFEAIMAFHEDMAIVKHERRSGMYHISAYYMAKMATEIPMQILLPFCTLTMVFWMCGLGTVGVYFAFVFVIILNVLSCQGIGIFFSLLSVIPKFNMTMAFVFMLFSLLTGGFFTTSIPFWLQWAKWLSFIRYCYHFNIYIVFAYLPDFECSTTKISRYANCLKNTTSRLPFSLSNNTQPVYFPASDVITNYPEEILPPWACLLVMILFFFFFRFAGYFVLRFKKV